MKKIVAFDARMASHPGIGRYIRSLLSAMISSECYQFRLIGDPQYLQSFAANAEIIPCTFPIYRWQEVFCMSDYYRNSDLAHVPHFNIPWKTKVPLIVTIHDLIHFQFKEYEPFPGALYLLRAQLKRAASQASKIIAVSVATQKACESMFPSMQEKIQVIYEAAEESLATQTPRPEKFSIQKYILCVGSVREHKNIQGVLKAFELILKKDSNIALVVLGKLDARFESKHQFKKRISENLRITHIDNASDHELIQYYQHAECLIAASFVEGFGLPVIEAMKSGTPCLISENTSLSEVAGSAGMTFNPYHAEDIAEKTLQLLADPSLQNRMKQKGTERANEFSWKKCAEETLALYDEVLAP